ncbi:MAG: hypothetical protein H6659_00635 [Ardenticatenaceae bacterium]|nr:hypothetical protein [Ardenticatenaceae bacterium]
MDCPKCQSSELDTAVSCPQCGYTAHGRSLLQLANLTFLLQEMAGWDVPAVYLEPLQQTYAGRLKTSEIELGLRQPPPDAAEAQILRQRRAQLHVLYVALAHWREMGWLAPLVAAQMREEINRETAVITQRLEDAPPPGSQTAVDYALRKLAEERAILQAAQELNAAGHLSAAGLEAITRAQEAAIEQAEIRAGLRPPQPLVWTAEKQSPADEPIQEKSPEKVRWQRPSITWDRVWESLLSERTLHAVLFLGVLLLLASGVSWVIWNWDTFPPLAQIAFLGSFTALFYGLGWFVRTRLKLEGSGIALSAVGSLLIPLDFYAFYISGGFPAGSWPLVWLLTSLVCLGAYLLTAVWLQATFFGYLVALAGLSLVSAGLNWWGVPAVWQQTAVILVAFSLAVLNEGLRLRPSRLRFLAIPFGQMALLLTAPTLILGLVWGLWAGGPSLAYYAALAASWWGGGLTLLIMTRRYRLQTMVWATALTFPVAIWMAQRVLFVIWPVDVAWYALGWLLLAPFYFATAVLLQSAAATDELAVMARKTAVSVGVLLVMVAALWSLQDGKAATAVHLLLAFGAAAAAWFSRRARLWWAMSLFLTIAAGAWQASRGASPEELALPGALLAVLHILAALLLRPRLGRRPNAFLTPLFGGALALAVLALLPPLALGDQPLLVYALANWLGINGWLAVLDYQQAAGVPELLAGARWRRLRPALFHWLTALPLPVFVWLLWTLRYEPGPRLGLLLAALAFAQMILAVALRRLRWPYGRPWQWGGVAAILPALALAFVSSGADMAVLIVWAAAFYCLTAVWVFHNARYFYAAGLLFPLAWLYIQDAVLVDWRILDACLGFFPLAYVLAGVWLEKGRKRKRPFTRPFFHMALVIGTLALLLDFSQAVFDWDRPALAWTALTPAAVGLAAAAYAWLSNRQRWAHLSIWLVTLAGGLLVKTYSHGSGRSAALVALMAAAYVLAERGLYALARRPKHASGWTALDFRRLWRLYRRPLLNAGWALAVAAIGLALIRNLILLGGGRVRESWAIVALFIICGLYALAARLFQNARFVWLAAALVIVPWTLATHLFWGDVGAWYGVSWVILALGLLGVGALLALRQGWNAYSLPPLLIAHGLVVAGLLAGVSDPAVSSVSVGLAILFYLGAVILDRAFYEPAAPVLARFAYPLAFLLPLWAVYLCLWRWPQATAANLALVVWAFAVPLLAVGRRLARWEPEYRWPFYLAAYSAALAALGLAVGDLGTLTAVLFLNSAVAVLSVWLFREPLWWYPATFLLPGAVWGVLGQIQGNELRHYGWSLMMLAGGYLAGAWALRRKDQHRYAKPLLVMTFVLVTSGLPLCSAGKADAFVGYGMAVMVLTAAALWLRRPFIFSFAVALSAVPYWVAVSWLDNSGEYAGLLAWPGIVAALWLALVLDARWGIETAVPTVEKSPTEVFYFPPGKIKFARGKVNFARGKFLTPPEGLGSFPWTRPLAWPTALWQRWAGWWALSLYGLAGLFIGLSALLAIDEAWQWLLVLAAGTAVFLWWTARFRLPLWLLAAGAWGQLAALAVIRLAGWTTSGGQVALAFAPVTAVTLALAVWIGGPRLDQSGRLVQSKRWAWPFYLLVFMDLLLGQALTLDLAWQSAAATLIHALLLGVVAQRWRVKALAYAAVGLTAVALAQWLVWLQVTESIWPQAMALWALAAGALGYGLRRWAREDAAAPGWIGLWERPLVHGGWLVSLLALGLAIGWGLELATAVPSLLFGGGLSVPQTVLAEMFIRTFALLGLLYLTAALAENRARLSYLALWLLLSAWSLWLLAIQGARELQLYAVPAGLYLLILGWLEWERGSQPAGRWLDWAGVLLLYGSALSQSFGIYGERYALLMVGEGLLLVWLGSLRRLRRLLYLGVAGVVTAVSGQLIEPLLALNTFVLLLLGAALVGLGIALERRLDKVRDLSRELRLKMEHWE